MQPEKTTSAPRPSATSGERLFTLEEANRALVLVRRVVQDIVTEYAHLMRLRSERDELGLTRIGPEAVERVRHDVEASVAKLTLLQEELGGVGCELKDWAQGLVDFPALHEGRKVWLCWRLGESHVAHWHEWNVGFSGRQPVAPGFSD